MRFPQVWPGMLPVVGISLPCRKLAHRTLGHARNMTTKLAVSKQKKCSSEREVAQRNVEVDFLCGLCEKFASR